MMFRNDSPMNLPNDYVQDISSINSDGRMRRTNSRGFDQMTPLAPGFFPGDDDVLVGRGKKCLVHTGNIRFKQIVATKLSAYLAAECRVDKTAILMEVIAQVRINSPNGGFVKQNPKTAQYFEVGDFLAKEKTAQAFRDALHEYYSSSNPSKKKRRIQSTVSAEKKASVTSSTATNDSKQEAEMEIACIGISQKTTGQSLVSAMHSQFTFQSTSRKTKSAPPSPVRENFVDPQRSHTPPPSFARFVSADPLEDAPLAVMVGEEITSMSDNSPSKRESSVILGDTLAVLSAAFTETGFALDAAPASRSNINNDNIFNDDPFEPIPLCEPILLSPILEDDTLYPSTA